MMLIDAFLLAVVLVSWGAQAAVPWSFAAGTAAGREAGADAAAGGDRLRRRWRAIGFPLALAGLVAAYALANRNPDATIAAALVPVMASVPGRLLAVLVPALLAAALLGGLGGERLGRAGERLAAGMALAACAVTAWAGELLRAGGGPATSAPRLLVLAACRLALMLAGGELLLAGRPRWAAAGGVALLLYLPLMPPEVRALLWSQGMQLTCGAAALLLLAARWLPRPLRLPAVAAGLLLAAVVLTHAGQVSQGLAPGIEYQEIPVLR